jgi:hypothetical protein
MTGFLTLEENERLRAAVTEAIGDGRAGLMEALETDPKSYLVLVDAAHVGADEAGRLLREAVASARNAGHSWEAIGAVLGVSRQAAQQRFGTSGDAVAGPNERVLYPLTAFTEMAALAKAGREGWHLVRFGPLHHVVEASDQQWEHWRDPLSLGSRRRRLEEAGWQGIGAWFPWRYYKRPLGLPPETAGD